MFKYFELSPAANFFFFKLLYWNVEETRADMLPRRQEFKKSKLPPVESKYFTFTSDKEKLNVM